MLAIYSAQAKLHILMLIHADTTKRQLALFDGIMLTGWSAHVYKAEADEGSQVYIAAHLEFNTARS